MYHDSLDNLESLAGMFSVILYSDHCSLFYAVWISSCHYRRQHY